jgi:Ser/Thr protein kinase RdoA (MazF antagonist)
MPAHDHRNPVFSAADAIALAEARYGINARAEPLPSYIDQNFLLTTDDGDRYVLKIANALEDEAVLDLQNKTMDHLARYASSDIAPRLFSSLEHEDMVRVPGPDGALHLVRLLSYLPGQPMREISPPSPRLLASLGRLLGEMDRLLVSFTHPAARGDLLWDLRNAPQVRPFFDDIEDLERRRLAEAQLDRFERSVLPAGPQLRMTVIHNDANPHNVLVGEDGEQAAAVIDFGDMTKTFTICELAIASTYAMMGRDDPIRIIGPLIAGYHASLRIKDRELDVLFPLIMMRLATSVAMSAHRRQLDPENEYIAVDEAPAWAALERLADERPDDVSDAFATFLSQDVLPEDDR